MLDKYIPTSDFEALAIYIVLQLSCSFLLNDFALLFVHLPVLNPVLVCTVLCE